MAFKPYIISHLLEFSLKFFMVSKGMHQGSPPSLLLFALSIEPLTMAIMLHPDIKGYLTPHSQYKVCIYADDTHL